jgi:hypothetical protein
VLEPRQTDAFDAETVTVGCEPTVIVIVCTDVQPFAAVPVTVYVVVAAGETVMLDPVSAPGFHR